MLTNFIIQYTASSIISYCADHTLAIIEKAANINQIYNTNQGLTSVDRSCINSAIYTKQKYILHSMHCNKCYTL